MNPYRITGIYTCTICNGRSFFTLRFIGSCNVIGITSFPKRIQRGVGLRLIERGPRILNDVMLISRLRYMLVFTIVSENVHMQTTIHTHTWYMFSLEYMFHG